MARRGSLKTEENDLLDLRMAVMELSDGIDLMEQLASGTAALDIPGGLKLDKRVTMKHVLDKIGIARRFIEEVEERHEDK